MGQLIVNGQVIGDSNNTITITPEYTEGILIATITVNGEEHKIYIPSNGGNQ